MLGHADVTHNSRRRDPAPIHGMLFRGDEGIAVTPLRPQAVAAFDPGLCRARFRLGMTDHAAAMLLPPLVEAMREQAPEAALILRQVEPRQTPRLLATGAISTLVGSGGRPGADGTHQRRLGQWDWVALRDAQTPPVDRLDAFCARPQLVISPSGRPEDHVDAALALIGRQRRVTTTLPASGLLAAALRGTDLIAVVPTAMARGVQGLCADRLPVAVAPLSITMSWRDSADGDAGECWFRDLITRCHRMSVAIGDERQRGDVIAFLGK
jgi:LysR family transcriptional activator of mexEF-oprN operon